MIYDFGPFYPDLVKVFYSNLSIDPDCVVKSSAKGKQIVLTMEDFGEFLSIPYEGERICQGFTCDYKDCEKNVYYFSINMLYKHEIFAKIGRYYGTTPNWLILYSSNLMVSDNMLHYFIDASSFQSIQIIRKLMIWKCNLSMM